MRRSRKDFNANTATIIGIKYLKLQTVKLKVTFRVEFTLEKIYFMIWFNTKFLNLGNPIAPF